MGLCDVGVLLLTDQILQINVVSDQQVQEVQGNNRGHCKLDLISFVNCAATLFAWILHIVLIHEHSTSVYEATIFNYFYVIVHTVYSVLVSLYASSSH